MSLGVITLQPKLFLQTTSEVLRYWLQSLPYSSSKLRQWLVIYNSSVSTLGLIITDISTDID